MTVTVANVKGKIGMLQGNSYHEGHLEKRKKCLDADGRKC
jgi:hypothetical protein